MSQRYHFVRYLAAKKSVDDRSLNRHVWSNLAEELPRGSPEKPVRVLEIGAGIGTMVERTLDWCLLDYAEYTALDAQPEVITHGRERLQNWAEYNDWDCNEGEDEVLIFAKNNRLVGVRLANINLFDYLEYNRQDGEWDLVIANAFLDLVDIPATLPKLFRLLNKAGIFYFSINFDGLTLLEPTIDAELDEKIQELYHRSMDERTINGSPSGGSRSGRRLFQYLQEAGGEILSAGASDWVVFPGVDRYPHDEAYFLHYIVQTIHDALHKHPELDQHKFNEWIHERHAQIDRHELIYIAHQLDFVGRVLDI